VIGRCQLDTNVIIALFAGEIEVKGQLTAAAELFVPSMALGELSYGARKSANPQENPARINGLIDSTVVIGFDTERARKYSEAKNNLKRKAQPLPLSKQPRERALTEELW